MDTLKNTGLKLCAAAVALGILLGCGGGGSDTAVPAPAPTAPVTTTATVSGAVVKGPLTGATITFFTLNADGSKGSQLGTSTTNTDGNYTVTLTPAPTAPFLAEASGGSYVDEATGATVPLSATDRLTAVLPVGTTRATITPLTHIAAARAQALAAGGTPLATAVDTSNTGVAAQYGIADIVATLPPAANNANSVATSTREERIYALVLAGIAQQASAVGVRAIDLAKAFAEDVKDGMFDGKNGAAAINVTTISGAPLPLPATAGTVDVQAAINAFIASVNNKTNLTQVKIPLTAVNLGVNTAGRLYPSSPVLPAAVSGRSYTASLTATGGTPPFTCALKAGSSLPPGFSLVASTCQITGTAGIVANESISAPFVVTLTDSATPAQTIEFAPLHLTTVLPAPVLAFAGQGTISEGTGGAIAVSATGGVPPYRFKFDTFANGTPPLGAAVDLFTGTVTIPATAKAGTYAFGVCVVDLGGRSSCRTTTVTVSPPAAPAPAPAPTPAPTPTAPTAAPFAGTWVGTWSRPSFGFCSFTRHDLSLTLVQNGNSLSGSYRAVVTGVDPGGLCPDPVGTVKTDTIAFGSVTGSSFTVTMSGGTVFSGTLSGNTLAGNGGTSGGTGPFTVSK